MSRTELMKSAGTRMLSALNHLRQNYFGLAIVFAVGVVLWAAGWEVIGILVTVIGGLGLFWGLITSADTGFDVVTEAAGRPDNDVLRLSKAESQLVTFIRDKKIDPATVIARLQEAK